MLYWKLLKLINLALIFYVAKGCLLIWNIAVWFTVVCISVKKLHIQVFVHIVLWQDCAVCVNHVIIIDCVCMH